jgi:DNA-binding transcriptional ArsR family regulator
VKVVIPHNQPISFMKRYLLSPVLFVCIVTGGAAQATLGGNDASGLDMNTEIGGMVSVVDFTNYDPVGNVYLFEDWKSGKLTLKNGVQTGNLILRVNLLNNNVDVKDKNRVRTFSIEKIQFVDISVLSDSAIRYINPNEYRYSDQTPIIGLLRDVSRGETWSLVERHFIKIYEANYVKALDAGSKQDRYESAKEYYFLRDGIVYPASGNRKKFASGLGLSESEQEALVDYVKSEGLSTKNVDHLTLILRFLNRG